MMFVGLKTRLKKVDNSQKKSAAVVELGQWHEINDELTFGVFSKDQLPKDAIVLARFKLPPDALPLRLRSWQKDDRLRLKKWRPSKGSARLDQRQGTAAAAPGATGFDYGC